MWILLVSPCRAISAAVLVGYEYVLSYIIFVALSRLFLSLILCIYSRQVDLSYSWILYLNQVINASVKVYCIFRLSKQRWSNRGNQSSEDGDDYWLNLYRTWMARVCTVVAVCLLFLSTIHYSHLVEIPSQEAVRDVIALLF